MKRTLNPGYVWTFAVDNFAEALAEAEDDIAWFGVVCWEPDLLSMYRIFRGQIHTDNTPVRIYPGERYLAEYPLKALAMDIRLMLQSQLLNRILPVRVRDTHTKIFEDERYVLAWNEIRTVEMCEPWVDES